MATEGGHTNDPTARRRRIVEKGSDRLALITGNRVTNPSSSAPSLPDENLPESGGSKAGQPVSHKSESTTKMEAYCEPKESRSKLQTNSKTKIYLYKALSVNQLQPAILASQEMRRKCSLFIGIVVELSYIGFPILGSYIIRSIILCRPLILLLFINISIIVGPLLLDAMKLIHQDVNATSEDTGLPDNLGSPFEWGMLFKTCLCAFFMDSCIYTVFVVCTTSVFQKLGL